MWIADRMCSVAATSAVHTATESFFTEVRRSSADIQQQPVYRWVPPRRNATTLPRNHRGVVVIFFHLRKCAGVSVRELFARQGAWRLAPYCLPAGRVLKGLRAGAKGAGAGWTFWELHCDFDIQRVRQLVATVVNVTNGATVLTFTSLRHPVDLVMSEYSVHTRATGGA